VEYWGKEGEVKGVRGREGSNVLSAEVLDGKRT